MKILHLFDRYLNTTMNWAYNMITHMDGVETYIAAPIIINNEFIDDDFNIVESPLQKITGRPKDEWHISYTQKLYAKIGFQSFIKEIENTILSHDIQLIHLHFASVACRHMDWLDEMQIPFIVSFYGYDYEKLPFVQPKYLQLYQRLFKLANRIICEGEHGKEILIKKHQCPASKIEVVPIGVNNKKIPFHTRTKKQGELSLLQLATFTEKKGHIFTLKAFDKALKKCPNMHLYLAGEEWGQGIMKKLKIHIQQKNIASKVTFMDFIPYDKLHADLKNYHALIQPSVYARNKDCEGGAPVIILDAMATGMPVIGSDHCDIPNIISNDKNGWICPSKNIDCLFHRLVNLYEMNQLKYDEFGSNAHQTVVDQFNIIDTSQHLKRIYNDIIH